MSNQEPIGILQTSFTVSLTFTSKPTEEMRQRLKQAGYLFDKGRWFRNQSDSKQATVEAVEQLLADR